MIRRRLTRRLLIIFASVLLAVTFILTSPAYAQSGAAPGDCGITVIGLHGLNETATDSQTLNSTWEQFAALMDGRGVPYASILVNHETLNGTQFIDQLASGLLTFTDTPISRGRDQLDTQARHVLEVCPTEKLALVGYSEGAWIIDDWIRQADPLTVQQIAAVVLYGDPQWQQGNEAGIARRVGQGLNPYILPSVADRTWSFCNQDDPICGVGYGPDNHEASRQIADARDAEIRLQETGYCGPHCDYVPGWTKVGAEVLLSRAPQGVG